MLFAPPSMAQNDSAARLEALRELNSDMESAFPEYAEDDTDISSSAHQLSKARDYEQAGDYEEALKWYRLAADQGHVDAQNNLGVMYHNGAGVAQDYVKALRWYRAAAEQGDAVAQSNLGVMYFYGQGVPQDYVKAVEWYRAAAVQGNAAAQYILGLMYHDGSGVPQDHAKAVQWYRQAAAKGNADAQNNLAVIYLSEESLPQESGKAVEYYTELARQTLESDNLKLAEMMLERAESLNSGHADLAALRQRLEEMRPTMLAEANNLFSEAVRAWYWEYERNTRGYRLIREAAEMGHVLALANLAEPYWWGIGVPQNQMRAQALARDALPTLRARAEAGEPHAQYLLGWYYSQDGLVFEADYDRALKWHRRAAEQGYAPAQNSLGVSYEFGDGVSVDNGLAAEWYRKAAEQGYPDAQYGLGFLYHSGKEGVSHDEKLAAKWYQKAAEQGVSEAQNQLGYLYESGKGVEKNYKEAIKWYRKAARQGHRSAEENLRRLKADW